VGLGVAVEAGEDGADVRDDGMTVRFWGVVNVAGAFLSHLLAGPHPALFSMSSMGVVDGDATVLDWLTVLVPERARTMIAGQMADLLQHRSAA